MIMDRDQYQANTRTKQDEENLCRRWYVEDCRHIVCTAKDCPRPWPCRAGQEIYCDECSYIYKPGLALFRCGECRKNLCDIHAQAHLRARSTYAHKIWKLVQTPSKVSAVKLPLKVCGDSTCLRCTTRSTSEPEEENTYLKCGHCLTPLRSFCRVCKHFVCLECYDSECVDDSHPMGDSRTLGKEWRDSLTTNDSEKALVETLRVLSRELKSSLANISEQRESACRAAGKFYGDLIAAVKTRQQQVQLDIDRITAKKQKAIKNQLELTEEVTVNIEALAMALEDQSVDDLEFLNTLQYLNVWNSKSDVVKQANETLVKDCAFGRVMFTFSNETAATLYSDISRIGEQVTSMSLPTLPSAHHNTDSLDTVDGDNSTPAEVDYSTYPEVENYTPPEVENSTPAELDNSMPAEVENSTPAEVENSTPAEVETSTPAEVETSTPAEVENSTPAEVENSTPTEVENSTPAEVENSTPAEVENSTLAEVENSMPAEVENSTPAEVENSTPAEVENSTPAEVENSTPAEVENSTPAEVENSTPAEVENSTPAEVENSTPAEVENSTPAEVENSTPAEVENSTPAEVENSTPAEVEHSTPAEVENSMPAEASTAQRGTLNTLLVVDSISSDVLPCHPSSRAFDTQHSASSGLALENGNRTARATDLPCCFKMACSSAIGQELLDTAITVVIDKTHGSHLYMGVCFSAHPVFMYPGDPQMPDNNLIGWVGNSVPHNHGGRRLGQDWKSGDVISMKLERTKRSLWAMHHRTGTLAAVEYHPGTVDTTECHWFVALLDEGDQVSFSRVPKHQRGAA